MTARRPAPAQDQLAFPECIRPGCHYPVPEDDGVCADCLQVLAGYVAGPGISDAEWIGQLRALANAPACGHTVLWWRSGRCDRCGCTELRDVSPAVAAALVPDRAVTT